MRDHRKLEAFGLADELTIKIYQLSRAFPEHEKFGLTSQLRRAAISIGANIVEGSARSSEAEYIRFLNIAYASSCELEYELSIAVRLGYISTDHVLEITNTASRTCRTLRRLVTALSSRVSKS